MSLDDESGADVIEHGSGTRRFSLPGWLGFRDPGLRGRIWRPSRGAAAFAAAALLAGLAAGYAAGKGTTGATPAPRATVTESPGKVPATVNPLADVGPAVGQVAAESCSVQAGTDLQLGVAVTNLSGTSVILTRVRPVFPMSGGLRAVSWAWAPCAANTYGTSQSTIPLAPGSSAWLSVTVKVLVSCPAPFPVEFNVTYLTGHISSTVTLPGFSDLGQVRYSGCSPSGSAGSGSSTFSVIFLGPAGSPVTVHTLERGLHRVLE